MTTMTIVIAEDDYDVARENSFHKLNTLGFVRGATSLDQCYLLVNEGWEKTRFPQNEVVRDYLVTMLHRYLTHTELFAQLSAFNYMEYLFGKRSIDAPCVNDVADMCLQCAAFFPDMSARRHEMKSHQYIIDVGISLYGQLARMTEKKNDWFSRSFTLMAEYFVQAMLILRSTCPRLVQAEGKLAESAKGGIPLLTDAKAHEMNRTVHELEQLFFESHALTATQLQ